MTLLASLFANSIVPLSPAIGPSALLPSHGHTTFQVCPAAITPGIAVDGGGAGGSAAAAVRSPRCAPSGIAKGGGGVLHLARTPLSPGFCQDCWLLPRAKAEEGLCAEAAAAAQPTSTARAIVDFMLFLLGSNQGALIAF